MGSSFERGKLPTRKSRVTSYGGKHTIHPIVMTKSSQTILKGHFRGKAQKKGVRGQVPLLTTDCVELESSRQHAKGTRFAHSAVEFSPDEPEILQQSRHEEVIAW